MRNKSKLQGNRKNKGFMITTSMWTVISKSEKDKNFALKQNERDCPMTCVSR